MKPSYAQILQRSRYESASDSIVCNLCRGNVIVKKCRERLGKMPTGIAYEGKIKKHLINEHLGKLTEMEL